MIEARSLTMIYGNGNKATDDISFAIKAGEIVGFAGPNGAGKTTVIKMLTGILKPTSGTAVINGFDINNDPIKAKMSFAYIADNPDILIQLTGLEYLNFIADVFGVSAEVRKERIESYAELFEIKDSLAQAISSYSHGMKQKLAIISALIHEPKLMILDEPFVGLDPKASHILKGIMRDICDNGGAIFFSTHVLDVAEKLCDRVAIIKEGKLIRSGAMEEVKGDT